MPTPARPASRRTPVTPPDLLAAIERAQWREALRLAVRFRHLGEAKVPIAKAWAAAQHPDFYRALGHDPDALWAAGVTALRSRFDPSFTS